MRYTIGKCVAHSSVAGPACGSWRHPGTTKLQNPYGKTSQSWNCVPLRQRAGLQDRQCHSKAKSRNRGCLRKRRSAGCPCRGRGRRGDKPSQRLENVQTTIRCGGGCWLASVSSTRKEF